MPILIWGRPAVVAAEVSPRACGVGLCGGTLASPVFKNVVVSVPAFQPRDDLGGSGWKPAQTHFQAISVFASWNTRRHSECSSLFQRSSRGSGRAASEGDGHWARRPAGSNRTGAGSRSAPPPRAGAAPVARRRRLAQSGVPVFRSVPGRSSVPGSGSEGRRPLWAQGAAPIDAQSDFASIAVLTASHRPAARPAGGRAAVWHAHS